MDRRTRQLVERNLEILSEASRRLPNEYKDREAQISWRATSWSVRIWSQAWRPSASPKPKGNERGALEFAHFVGCQFADVVCQSGFLQADQSIALNRHEGRVCPMRS
jgi:hypothetical protein